MQCPNCSSRDTQYADTPENTVCKATVKHRLGKASVYCLESVDGSWFCNECYVPFTGKVYGDPGKSRVRIIVPYRSLQK